MSLIPIGDPRQKVTVASLRERKVQQQPITCLTAYDYASETDQREIMAILRKQPSASSTDPQPAKP